MQVVKQTISVVICTRDRVPDLLRCLESIRVQSTQPDEIIIICGSEASCPEDIDSQFPSLCLNVQSCFENNISMSRNVGIAYSASDLILFIDDDAVAQQGWVDSYLEFFHAHPEAWIAGGPVFDSRESPMEYEFNRGQLSPLGLQKPVSGSEEKMNDRGYKLSVKGCNFAVCRERIVRIGSFDSYFRFAYDESDLVYSIYAAEGGVGYCEGAIVEHAHTPGHYRSTGRLNHDWFVEYASHTMFMLKHTSGRVRFRGYWILLRRFLKLIATAIYCVIQSENTIEQASLSLRNAFMGIMDARKTYASRH